MATRDGLAQIWYADANGVITGYTPTADNVASAIIDAYNEHFGTDINIWTPETKNLQVGDTVPNWNAYEKIEMQIPTGQYLVYDIDRGCLYNMSEEGLSIYAKSESEAYYILTDGTVLDETIPLSMPAIGYQIEKINEKFGTSYTSESINKIITQWQPGFKVENFELIEQ